MARPLLASRGRSTQLNRRLGGGSLIASITLNSCKSVRPLQPNLLQRTPERNHYVAGVPSRCQTVVARSGLRRGSTSKSFMSMRFGKAHTGQMPGKWPAQRKASSGSSKGRLQISKRTASSARWSRRWSRSPSYSTAPPGPRHLPTCRWPEGS